MPSSTLVISLVLLLESWYYHNVICHVSDRHGKVRARGVLGLGLRVCSQAVRHHFGKCFFEHTVLPLSVLLCFH